MKYRVITKNFKIISCDDYLEAKQLKKEHGGTIYKREIILQ